MEDLDTRLAAATGRRDTLSATVQRIEGKLESARTALQTLEETCRSKGLEPDQIEEAITKLTRRYEALVEQIEQEVDTASAALEPFLKESSTR
jgi:chromosome segregation ATPase